MELPGVSLEVPPGALGADTRVSLTRTDEAPPDGIAARSPVYRFEPEGLQFSQPVTVTFTVPDAGAEPLSVFWSAEPGFSTWLTYSEDGGPVPPRGELEAWLRDAGRPVPDLGPEPLFKELLPRVEGDTLTVLVRHFSKTFYASSTRANLDPQLTTLRVDKRHAAADGTEAIVISVRLRDPDDAGVPYRTVKLASTHEPAVPGQTWPVYFTTDAFGDGRLELRSSSPVVHQLTATMEWYDYWVEWETTRVCGWWSCWDHTFNFRRSWLQGSVPVGDTVVSFGEVDECATSFNTCGANAVCTNTPESFDCACSAGFEGDGFTCRDLDECAQTPRACSPDATCTNTPGAFSCACKAGFSGDGRTCADVDECAQANGGCAAAATCTNTPGSRSCACQQGFTGDGLTCTDVDECATGTAGCSANADCLNAPGTFGCACRAGYQGDGQRCDDIDECATNHGGCSPDADCTNSPGSHACTCRAGYAGNGLACADIDECSNGTCSPLALCANSPGSFRCICPSGFSGDGLTCTDIDECAVNHGGCSAAATCTNSPGSFFCNCNVGYVGDGVTCADIDECAPATRRCSWDADCANTPGSVNCTCRAGFVGDGVRCDDVDECALGQAPRCAANSVCQNTPGAYDCSCMLGFEGDPLVGCVDIDECARGTAACDAFADCINDPGLYHCACRAGFAGSGVFCSNINECLGGAPFCDVNATCTDLHGSFTCECKPGWAGDGGVCVDDNECLTSPGICGPHATCTDTPGAYECTCDEGWARVGSVCQDVNECLLGTSGCAPETTCVNTIGAWECQCPPGSSGDGGVCVDLDECALQPGRCGVGGTCVNLPLSYSCQCTQGYQLSSGTCVDLNECLDPGACAPQADCQNFEGGFGCLCRTGFEGDGGTCADVDECALVPGPCGANTTCVNATGGFSCQCVAGYHQATAFECIDTNECQTANGGCDPNASCDNLPGAFSCTCKPGYSGNGQSGTALVCTVIPTAPPDAPAGVTARGVSALNGNEVTWPAVAGAAEYEVLRSLCTPAFSPVATTMQTSFVDTGLSGAMPETAYCYAVVAKNPLGNSAPSSSTGSAQFPVWTPAQTAVGATVRASQLPVQSFTVTAAGTLRIIEVSWGMAGPVGFSDTLDLTVYDENDQPLGTVHKYPPMSLATATTGFHGLLSSLSLFEVSGLGIAVSAGQVLKFGLSATVASMETCTQPLNTCSFTGTACVTSADCGLQFSIEAAPTDAHAGGALTLGGVPTTQDLAFRVLSW